MTPFPLPASEVHLWFVDQRAVAPDLSDRYVALLSASERERYMRFLLAEPAHEFLVGRALLRSVLGSYLGIAPEAVRLRLGVHGKPELAEPVQRVAFSLAHSHGFVACVAARDCDLGVDVEDVERAIDAFGLAERFFEEWEFVEISKLEPAARSLRFFQFWTLKEACLKALGTGLVVPLDRFCFCFRADGKPRLRGDEARSAWQLVQLKLSDQHLAAVAIKHRGQPVTRRLVVRRCIPLGRPSP